MVEDRPEILAQIPAECDDVLLESLEAMRVDVDNVLQQTGKVIMKFHKIALSGQVIRSCLPALAPTHLPPFDAPTRSFEAGCCGARC